MWKLKHQEVKQRLIIRFPTRIVNGNDAAPLARQQVSFTRNGFNRCIECTVIGRLTFSTLPSGKGPVTAAG